jgi:hypothetical protein
MLHFRDNPPPALASTIGNIVDLDRYPIDDLGTAAARAVIDHGRAQLGRN